MPESHAHPFTIYHNGSPVASVYIPMRERSPPPIHQITVEPDQLPTVPSPPSSSYFWQILLGLILVLLLAAAIVLPLVLIKSTTVSTTTTSETTTTSTTATSATSTTSKTTTISTATTTTTSQTTTTATTATTATLALPSQCYSYVSNTDGTRSVSYGVQSSGCDSASTFGSSPAWVRFSGAAGTVLANSAPSIHSCSTDAPGWYSGSYPSAGGTTSGTVCYNWNGNTCNWSNAISVTNCNGFYVYQLTTPPNCSLRYCTM